MLISRSLISFSQQCVQMYSKVLDHLKQILLYREISLSVVRNMNKYIIKSIKGVLEMVSLSFAYLNCDKKNLVPSSYLEGKVLLLICSKLSK